MRVALALFLLPLVASGCFSGPLGSLCEDEGDCDFGLRCFGAPNLDGGICTVRCIETCTVGACTVTEHGTLCLRPCEVPGECPSNQRCQAAPGAAEFVCWGLDANLTPIPGEDEIFLPPTGAGRPEITKVEVTQDENDDGAVNPGESVALAVHLRNAGGDPLVGLSGALTSRGPAVRIERCDALGGSYCSERTAEGCSCFSNSYGYTLDIEPGAAGPSELIEVGLDVAEDAAGSLPFELSVVDDAGNQWTLDLAVPVVAVNTRVQIARSEVTRDDNEDGLINPGETVELDVYVDNPGATVALDVWASVEAGPPIALDRCSALGGSYCSDRTTTACSCASNSYSMYAEVQGALAAEALVITLELKIERGAAPGQVSLPMTFGDRLGNTWQDTLVLDVVATGGRPEVAAVEVDDANGNRNGVLNLGETAGIGVVLRNAGTSALTGLWAEVTAPNPTLKIQGCDALGGGYCRVEGGAHCSCDGNSYSLYQDLAALESATNPVIVFDLAPESTAPTGPQRFSLVVGDSLGNRWPLSFDVVVAP